MTSTNSLDSTSPVPLPPIQNVPVTVDSKGRVRVSKEQRQTILAEFARSGVSAVQFAQRTGLKYSTLAGWLQRYHRAKLPRRTRAVRLLEAVVAGAQPPAGPSQSVLVVQLPGGARVEVADETQAVLAAALIRALTRSC